MAELITKKQLLKWADKISHKQKICIKCEEVYEADKNICHCDNDE